MLRESVRPRALPSRKSEVAVPGAHRSAGASGSGNRETPRAPATRSTGEVPYTRRPRSRGSPDTKDARVFAWCGRNGLVSEQLHDCGPHHCAGPARGGVAGARWKGNVHVRPGLRAHLAMILASHSPARLVVHHPSTPAPVWCQCGPLDPGRDERGSDPTHGPEPTQPRAARERRVSPMLFPCLLPRHPTPPTATT